MEATITTENNKVKVLSPAEALLSLIIRGNEKAIEAAKNLNVSDFVKTSDKILFDAIVDLQAVDLAADEIILSYELHDNQEAIYHLNRLTAAQVDDSNATSYADCVRLEAQRHRRLNAVAQLQAAIQTGEGLTAAAQAVDDSLAAARQTGVAIGNCIKDFINHVQLRQKGKGPEGIMTGIKELDDMTNGFQPGQLVVIAARPSVGKTALAMNIAHHTTIAQQNPKGVVFFSLEMERNELTGRILSGESGVNSSKFGRPGAMQDEDWSKLTAAANSIFSAPLNIDDQAGLELDELCSRARKWCQEREISLIIIDYLQLIRRSGSENRLNEISEISRALKKLAKDLEIPVIALSQLNRELEKRADKRPVLSDLRESGAIEQDADIILFIYREAVYCDECRKPDIVCSKGHARDAEIIVAKQRNGVIGNIKAKFFGETQQFISANDTTQNQKVDNVVYMSNNKISETAKRAAAIGIEVFDDLEEL